MDVLAKYDMTSDEDKGLVATIKLPEGYIGGEFIMVPRSAPSAASESDEDDGWLLGHVTDETTWKSFILVSQLTKIMHSASPCSLVTLRLFNAHRSTLQLPPYSSCLLH